MITLGQTYTDKITGFTGVAISRSEYLYGCVHIGLQAKECKDGKPVETQFFDEQRVDPDSQVKSGGPASHPPAPRRP